MLFIKIEYRVINLNETFEVLDLKARTTVLLNGTVCNLNVRLLICKTSKASYVNSRILILSYIIMLKSSWCVIKMHCISFINFADLIISYMDLLWMVHVSSYIYQLKGTSVILQNIIFSYFYLSHIQPTKYYAFFASTVNFIIDNLNNHIDPKRGYPHLI